MMEVLHGSSNTLNNISTQLLFIHPTKHKSPYYKRVRASILYCVNFKEYTYGIHTIRLYSSIKKYPSQLREGLFVFKTF